MIKNTLIFILLGCNFSINGNDLNQFEDINVNYDTRFRGPTLKEFLEKSAKVEKAEKKEKEKVFTNLKPKIKVKILNRDRFVGDYDFGDELIFFGNDARRVIKRSDKIEINVGFPDGFDKEVIFKIKNKDEIILEGKINKTSDSPVNYSVKIDANILYKKQDVNTFNNSYMVFRTTNSKDTIAFDKFLQKQKKPSKLPSYRSIFLDEEARTTRKEASKPPKSKYTEKEDYYFSTREIFEAGGLLRYQLEIITNNQTFTQRLVISDPSDWVYYSGHYPYNMGGLVGNEFISPDTVDLKEWKDKVEVLIFAACYAVDINDPNNIMGGSKKGINGSGWWNKFGGTLLGYGGSAPSSLVDVAVIKEFLSKMKKSKVDPKDKILYSQELTKQWMKVNTVNYSAYAAAAVDVNGTYYYVPKKNAKVKGRKFRSSIIPWVKQSQKEWGPKNKKMILKDKFSSKLIGLIEKNIMERGGKPFTLKEIMANETIQKKIKEMGFKVDEPEVLSVIRGSMEYAAHIFYDLPDKMQTARALSYMGDFLEDAKKPISIEKVVDYFTPPMLRPRHKLPSKKMIRNARFTEFMERIFFHEKVLGIKDFSEKDMKNRLADFFKLTKSDNIQIQNYWKKFDQ
ncbi:MAG: hypothetical protein COB02_17340 [Candidatus Cloacimonadota bacterium]|nr:MAG: hypothetical protein COB02_17340 [Candidatus Cloacimonadota bacterium]